LRSAYEILGVARDADSGVIRAAYRAFVAIEHPDRHGGTSDANERFLEVKAAYEILIDPDRRAAHDADPSGVLVDQVARERRKAQLRRRRERLRRLYE
jgi:DnaJ-class molecular chaperone